MKTTVGYLSLSSAKSILPKIQNTEIFTPTFIKYKFMICGFVLFPSDNWELFSRPDNSCWLSALLGTPITPCNVDYELHIPYR